MSSIEDHIIDENVVKETPNEDPSLKVGMENLRLRDYDHHTRERERVNQGGLKIDILRY